MINKIWVFTGSTRDFNSFLSEHIQDDESKVTLIEVIQHYNARLRPTESGVQEQQLAVKLQAKHCVVRTGDYGSVLEHVLSNFVNIVTRNYDIDTLYVQNPPKRVMDGLQENYSYILEQSCSEYQTVNRETLKAIYSNVENDVLGQTNCKREIISGLYKMTASSIKHPIVLLLYGPSGVGKTETAKSISHTLGGDLLRIQFSMMQTQEAFDYIFGAEHSKASFARDLLSRESNIILIDEFDKVNPRFYNAFYELFDEGRYVDTNYQVDLRHAVFILTCNFLTETEIRSSLGPAMFSRIGCCIRYSELSKKDKQKIISDFYSTTVAMLQPDEVDVIKRTDILKWFIDNAERYDNIRILKTKLENAIFGELADAFVIKNRKLHS